MAAERPGNDATISVSIGGVTINSNINLLPAFVPQQVSFTATATSAQLNFTNTAAGGDVTAFIDDISICVERPSCINVRHPPPNALCVCVCE
jgi:hypothetical protein